VKPALWATLGLVLAATWLTLTVHCNDGGNWTAFYYTGAQSTVPPQLEDEDVFQFPGTSGYDGMFYHYVAHDPLMRRGFARYVDNVRLRWRRILLPGLAWLLALGSDEYVDSVYVGVTLGFLWLGCFWLSRYCERNGLHSALGMAFIVLPPALVSLDRMTIDISLAALCIGAAVVEGPWLYVLLAAAPLARETGLILVAAYLISSRRWRTSFCMVPWLAWSAFVQVRTGADQTHWLGFPFSGIIDRTLHPVQFALTTRWLEIASALDYLALLGIWLAFLIAISFAVRRRFGLLELACVLFTVFASVLGKPDIWSDAYAFGRTLAPILIWMALIGISSRTWWYLAPVVMVIPRIVFQYAPQWKGVLHCA
jgi:hypothetical protein